MTTLTSLAYDCIIPSVSIFLLHLCFTVRLLLSKSCMSLKKANSLNKTSEISTRRSSPQSFNFLPENFASESCYGKKKPTHKQNTQNNFIIQRILQVIYHDICQVIFTDLNNCSVRQRWKNDDMVYIPRQICNWCNNNLNGKLQTKTLQYFTSLIMFTL